MGSWDNWVEHSLDKLERLQLLRSLRPIYFRNEPQKPTTTIEDDDLQVFHQMQLWDRSSVEVHIPESMFQKWLSDIPSSGDEEDTRRFRKLLLFSGNDYLGLSSHPTIGNAAAKVRIGGRLINSWSIALLTADPEGLELIIPDCCEDEELVPEKTYFGGEEGVGEYIWYRTKNKLHGSALLDISNLNEDVGICSKTLTYKPALEGVGAYLALYWVPTRKDGKCGKALVAICNSPVAPALPVVSNVRVKKVSLSVYSGEGEYFGGYEGWSLFSWYRETNDGTISLINGANSRTYEVTDADYNCRLLFGYTPVRSDSVVGELRLSEPTDIILPELPRLEMLALTGKAIEGDVLTVVEVIPESLTQQLVWHKYKQDVRYQWFFSSAVGDNKTFEPLQKRHCVTRINLQKRLLQ